MVENFAVELHRQVVGIAVRSAGGFVFFSSDNRFQKLDGMVFPRAKAILQYLQYVEAGAQKSAGRETNDGTTKAEQ